MIIMKDVAEAAGVSLITVSRVINTPELVKEETRNKIEKAMKELGFLPNHAAKALAENNTRAIHLYVPRYMSISEPFMMQLIAGVSEVLSEAYYLFLIRRDLEFNQRCDGVIVMGIQMSEEDLIKDQLNVPLVLFGKSKLEVDCIDIDNYKGAVMLTEHMISKGHRKIGFLMLKTDQRFAYERFEGYKYALQKNNIAFDKQLVRYAEDLGQSGYEKSLELISQEKPSAIFCCNDLLAIGACRAIEKIYGRSAENIREHRHVTSLLNRVFTNDYGVVVKPSLTFEEGEHKTDSMYYSVQGVLENGVAPISFFPVVEDFIGEGGNLLWPESVVKNHTSFYKKNQKIDGYEAIGGLRFEDITLLQGERRAFIIVMGISETIEEMDS